MSVTNASPLGDGDKLPHHEWHNWPLSCSGAWKYFRQSLSSTHSWKAERKVYSERWQTLLQKHFHQHLQPEPKVSPDKMISSELMSFWNFKCPASTLTLPPSTKDADGQDVTRMTWAVHSQWAEVRPCRHLLFLTTPPVLTTSEDPRNIYGKEREISCLWICNKIHRRGPFGVLRWK